jgi:small subunit ribosomal protein S3Ae
VKKWQTLIEAFVDVKTADNYILRVFVITFTKRRPNQVSKTSYAQHAQIRAIRKKIFEIVTKEVSSGELKDLVKKILPESIGAEIDTQCTKIYPLQNTFIRKVKIMKKPKVDLGKLLELHTVTASAAAVSEDKGAVVATDFKEPAIQATV